MLHTHTQTLFKRIATECVCSNVHVYFCLYECMSMVWPMKYHETNSIRETKQKITMKGKVMPKVPKTDTNTHKLYPKTVHSQSSVGLKMRSTQAKPWNSLLLRIEFHSLHGNRNKQTFAQIERRTS